MATVSAMDIAITGLPPSRNRNLADSIDRKLRFAFSRFGHLVKGARLHLTRGGCRLALDLASRSAITVHATGNDPLSAIDLAIAKALKTVARESARMSLALES